ncbi:MAG: hypothetical protein WCY41_03830 [Candidatus Micrarchaeia archaeon]
MKGKMVFVLALAMALAGGAFAAPILQIMNYSTVPTDVYPGTTGYLQIKLSNTGDSTAQAVTSHYVIDGLDKTDSLGEISSGSYAQVVVPFKISQGAVGSIQILNIDIYYTAQTSSTGNTASSYTSKKTSLSVPLMVKQYKPLEAKIVGKTDASISPGETLPLTIQVTNTGGVVNNLMLSMPVNSTFIIGGETEKQVGTIPLNSSANVSFTLVSSSDTATGTYSVPIVLTYQDALNQPTEETMYIGPISVLDASTQYRLTLVPLESPVEIGSEELFLLTLENAGNAPISGTLEINTTTVFTPLGAQRLYFNDVPAGGSKSMNVSIGVASSQSAGYYTLPIKLTPNAGQTVSYNMGISVSATPEITVTLDTSGTTPSVQVANTGNSQIRSVYASAKATGAQTATEGFLGTLNVDDFASLSLGSGTTGKSVDVEIRFRDSNNIEHSVKKTLDAVAGNSSFVQSGRNQSGTLTAGNSGNFASRNNNPLGMLFGAGGNSAGAGGIGIVPMAIGAVVVIGAGYFAYRKYIAKKPVSIRIPFIGKKETHPKIK